MGLLKRDTKDSRLVLEAEARRMNTIEDYARYVIFSNIPTLQLNFNPTTRFFAEAWNSPQPLSPSDKTALRLQQSQDLELLINSLPLHFTATIQQLQQDLPLLYATTFPTVLRHDDLCDMNILVKPSTGNITRVIDWAGASILPFGYALYGVLNVMGWMDESGWYWYADYQALERKFWEAFEGDVEGLQEVERQTIRVSSVLGIFLRYGFTWDERVRRRPVTGEDDVIKYLDAFCRRRTRGWNVRS
jgi:hypothetical protein